MKNIAIFASGNGTNAENIAKLFNNGTRARVALVITNRPKAGVIDRMMPLGVPVEYVPNTVWDNDPQQVVEILRNHNIDLVVLAGFMHYVSPVIIDAYKNRIVNIHPSLLPKYGGKGMYGHHVHEAVIAAGETESGVTVHYVTAEMDEGAIIMQEKVDIFPDDTAETLEAKIHPVEYSLYPRAIMKALDEASGTTPPASSTPPGYPMEYPLPTPGADAEPDNFQHPLPHRREKSVPPKFHGPAVPPRAPYIPQQMEERPPMPKNYLVWAILSTILCCVPFGIVAIIFSAKVASRYSQNDFDGAVKASERAQAWIIAAFVTGLIANTVLFPLQLLFS